MGLGRSKWHFLSFVATRLSASRAPSGPHTTPLAPNVISTLFFNCLAQQPNSGLGRHIVEVSRWHRHTHTHGRAPLNEGSARRRGRSLPTQNTANRGRTSVPSAGFESTIPEIKRSQTCALNRPKTGIGDTPINQMLLFFCVCNERIAYV